MGMFNYDFKCRCMTYHNQRRTGIELMSGEIFYHMNMIHQLIPSGLNRITYQVTDLDEWFDSDFEKGSKKQVRRKSNQIYGFKNNYPRK